MRKIFIILLLAALVFLFGCDGAGIEGSLDISVDELKTKLDNEEDFILLDVREPDVFYDGYIPGAFSLPRGLLEESIASEDYWDMQAWDMPGHDAEIIIYSRKGLLGALAAETLIKMGYTNVKNLYGGWVWWEGGEEAYEELLKKEAAPKVSGGCGG
ncbi:hypothetical protein JXI42_10775 [bacterium]|nr:hypothetical protein [bacterium]